MNAPSSRGMAASRARRIAALGAVVLGALGLGSCTESPAETMQLLPGRWSRSAEPAVEPHHAEQATVSSTPGEAADPEPAAGADVAEQRTARSENLEALAAKSVQRTARRAPPARYGSEEVVRYSESSGLHQDLGSIRLAVEGAALRAAQMQKVLLSLVSPASQQRHFANKVRREIDAGLAREKSGSSAVLDTPKSEALELVALSGWDSIECMRKAWSPYQLNEVQVEKILDQILALANVISIGERFLSEVRSQRRTSSEVSLEDICFECAVAGQILQEAAVSRDKAWRFLSKLTSLPIVMEEELDSIEVPELHWFGVSKRNRIEMEVQDIITRNQLAVSRTFQVLSIGVLNYTFIFEIGRPQLQHVLRQTLGYSDPTLVPGLTGLTDSLHEVSREMDGLEQVIGPRLRSVEDPVTKRSCGVERNGGPARGIIKAVAGEELNFSSIDSSIARAGIIGATNLQSGLTEALSATYVLEVSDGESRFSVLVADALGRTAVFDIKGRPIVQGDEKLGGTRPIARNEIEAGLEPEKIKRIQASLNVGVDGQIGAETRAAISRLQSRLGLQPTGALDQALIEILLVEVDE